ncbi:MAG: methyl-accepting chemotaxis protein [Amphritea sp.]|nr:methyl-accepting chemotaxis protein [Amphritea sp.]
MPIQTKVNLSLAFVLLLVLITSVSVIYKSETELSSEIARQNTKNTADAYFDSINIMMLSGTMSNRQALQAKILSNPELTEARIIRGDSVSEMYGPGTADSGIVDDLDRRAMKGESIAVELDDDKGHRLTVVRPMLASSDYKGTNCLTCHPVAEGSILGAVRVTYSFEKMDAQIKSNIINIALVELAMFVAALVLVGYMIHRIVLKPINNMNQTIRNIEENSDLTQQLEINSKDEIGQMATSFNSMVSTFHESIKHVVESIEMLGQCSHKITEVTGDATNATKMQQSRAEAVTNAMISMDAATQNVSASASTTVEASKKALDETANGVKITSGTVDKIEDLQQRIQHATDVIVQLEQQSYNIDAVLSVIQDIAEQTNLLALNAAIEAARAGEQGRGFAVVADEVRTLSQRTQNATVEINGIISSLQQNAKGAAQVMGEAREETESNVVEIQKASAALNNIKSEMEAITEINETITDSVRQSTAATTDIESAVDEINQGSEQAKVRVDKLANVSHQLTDLAKQLEQRAQQFKL